MWNWKRTASAKREPRKLYFPEEKIEELYALFDADSGAGKGRVSKLRLWRFILAVFPEVAEGQWTLRTGDLFHPFIEEGKDIY